ncbi:bifunctional adenosylcobinamide kinase/adenosylcobinamide-phosphate guanylyltransferase [Corallincola luteus]|uniref:Bifunctional adenosylcobalamin biosynthesis protein n=2 Tax=Corallincola TaxID=1775176 RepID=A0A368NFZ1_9GAMM|nr:MULTISPECIES: bifunctional adenosylcobinamide kinase/adenosylcobinamide-phosphate guanylyltransferase [Corallincola]RCU49388.1 bifunctional adenosylcobinamide kinase/adenosylcobinamide-phosphate guanylyltransferase [Corallincola holothuriorum]TCI01567.1 bifunctional adenosylcobinamide kinase/adenosylcobinamide-phosphate guanylyltransferase [Corallincola luteus]
MIELVLGGARSGKSAYAESLLKRSGSNVVYIATAQAFDQEMSERILHHQLQRPAEWQLIESPLVLAETLDSLSNSEHYLLVDCLTLWLSNHLLADESSLAAEIDRLLAVLARMSCRVLLVSNEVGMGIVPENRLARRFRDEAGWLNQRVAQIADKVTLVTAGMPLVLKGQNL